MKSAFSKRSDEINVLRSASTSSGPCKSDGALCNRSLCEPPAAASARSPAQPSVRAANTGLCCSLAVSGCLAASWLPSPPRPRRCVFFPCLPMLKGGCALCQCGAQTRTEQTALKTTRLNKELLFHLKHARVRGPGGDRQYPGTIPITCSCTPAPAPAAGASSCPILPAVPYAQSCA